MTAEDHVDGEEEGEVSKTIRRTTTLDYIDDKIIERLIGIFGRSRSAVISYIIKDWVKTNSDMLRLSYGIDIAGIRHELESSGEIVIDDQIQERLYDDILLRFKRMKKYNIERLASLLNVHPQTLIDYITIKGDELEKNGLNLQIDGEFVVKD